MPGLYALHLPWCRSVLGRLDAFGADLLISLVGPDRAIPDFLTPRPAKFAATFEEELAAVRRNGVLPIDKMIGRRRVVASGRGLLLVPSAFSHKPAPPVSPEEPPPLAYPCRGVATLWAPTATADPPHSPRSSARPERDCSASWTSHCRWWRSPAGSR